MTNRIYAVMGFMMGGFLVAGIYGLSNCPDELFREFSLAEGALIALSALSAAGLGYFIGSIAGSLEETAQNKNTKGDERWDLNE